tara:strand:+ start:164 stop:628 length:465 start_codon:yes stop_codon:yes gene_type:complete
MKKTIIGVFLFVFLSSEVLGEDTADGAKLPYWAGHKTVLVATTDDSGADGPLRCELAIVYSQDGKRYSATVDIPFICLHHNSSSDAKCAGTVDNSGVLERQECTPGNWSQRDLAGTVLNPILDNVGEGPSGGCSWKDAELLETRNLLAERKKSQ